MDVDKAHAYYNEMLDKGSGAAKFKRGLGFGSTSSQNNISVGEASEAEIKLKKSNVSRIREKLVSAKTKGNVKGTRETGNEPDLTTRGNKEEKKCIKRSRSRSRSKIRSKIRNGDDRRRRSRSKDRGRNRSIERGRRRSIRRSRSRSRESRRGRIRDRTRSRSRDRSRSRSRDRRQSRSRDRRQSRSRDRKQSRSRDRRRSRSRDSSRSRSRGRGRRMESRSRSRGRYVKRSSSRDNKSRGRRWRRVSIGRSRSRSSSSDIAQNRRRESSSERRNEGGSRGEEGEAHKRGSEEIQRGRRERISREGGVREKQRAEVRDYTKLIPGYEEMSTAEKLKAKMRYQLSETVVKDSRQLDGLNSEWERFDFDKNAPLDDDAKQDYFGDGTGAKDDTSFLEHSGSTFTSSQGQALRESRTQKAHEAAIFGDSTMDKSLNTAKKEDSKRVQENESQGSKFLEQLNSMEAGSSAPPSILQNYLLGEEEEEEENRPVIVGGIHSISEESKENAEQFIRTEKVEKTEEKMDGNGLVVSDKVVRMQKETSWQERARKLRESRMAAAANKEA